MCVLHALQRIKPFNQFNRHAVTNTGTNMTCICTNNPTITEQLAQDGIYTKTSIIFPYQNKYKPYGTFCETSQMLPLEGDHHFLPENEFCPQDMLFYN